MSLPDQRISSFQEFWPYYLREHANATCRRLHIVGTTLAFACLWMALFRSPVYLLIGLILGYAFAWVGHFVFEKNRPATFKYPLWSLAADWRMWGAFLAGKLGSELKRAGVA